VIRPVTFPLRRFRVEDDSMRPTLEPGDYVVVNRWAYRFRQPAKGDLVVVRDPEGPDRFLVKRISEVGPSQIEVLGDSPVGSRDSRRFGPVALDNVVGKVWIRLRR
jgi:nickel-type superoxide dismutase maturation protease